MHFDPPEVNFWGLLLTMMCYSVISAVRAPALKYFLFKSYRVVKNLCTFLSKHILFQLKLRLCTMFDVGDPVFSFRGWWSMFLNLCALFPVVWFWYFVTHISSSKVHTFTFYVFCSWSLSLCFKIRNRVGQNSLCTCHGLECMRRVPVH